MMMKVKARQQNVFDYRLNVFIFRQQHYVEDDNGDRDGNDD